VQIPNFRQTDISVGTTNRRNHIKTDTAQQEERPNTMGYTSAEMGPYTDTHNTTERTAHHYGIH
jgi:hypothetical protein